MLNIKALFAKIAKCLYTTGTDNGWTYKKYLDGTFEAWGTFNATGMALNTASSGTYYNNSSGVKNFPYPSFFKSITLILAKEVASMSSGVWIYTAQTSGSNMQVNYRSHASISSGAVCNGFFYIRGTWGGTA